MEGKEYIQPKLPNQELDYFKIIKILTSRWYWIAGSVVVFYIAALVYLWYTPQTFATTATMKFDEKRSEISDLVSVINNSDKGPSRVQSELAVLQSSNLLLNAIKDLDYKVSFFVEGRVRTSELYPHKPLKVNLLKFDSLNFYSGVITFKPINKTSFNLTYNEGGVVKNNKYIYFSPITIGNTVFNIASPGSDSRENAVFLFKFNIPESFLGRVKGGFSAGETAKNSNIIALRETDSNPVFAADVLNAIMNEYLKYDRGHKTESATQMIQFIDDQLDTMRSRVKGSEGSIQNFKQSSKILDVSTASDSELGKAKDIDAQRSLLKIQLLAVNQLKQQVDQDRNNANINFNFEGNIDPMLAALVSSLNNLITEKQSLLKIYNTASPQIQSINQQILEVKNSAYQNINTTIARLRRNIEYLDAQLSGVNQRIEKLPIAERNLVSLKRDFEVNDKVYSFLSEKKLEAQISRSAILPGASIIEPAQPNHSPVSPNVGGVKRQAIIYGLVLGLGAIILIRILNPYIYDKETIESLTTVPIIGVIRKFPHDIDESGSKILALSKPKSIFAESVRSVRTNLNFLAAEKKSKVICITSEIAGEGKSFVAVNLSSTLSLIDKKVVIIAADLRRSKLHKTLGINNNIGLSNYLINQNSLEEIIQPTEQENLDFISSGPVPPNPSELLHTRKMTDLIEKLRERYDIIMVDTAPVGLVSDAIPLIRLSDINVFVIRSGKSKYYSATIPQKIASEYHLNNTVIILNAFKEDILHSRYYTTKFTGESYNTRYYYYSDYSGYDAEGYYTDDEQKNKWWNIKRWFK
ncbi:GumC family protein [Mucilaginibacter auburnensis]|uniref:non-specific protein-tyrosine kinase n=1 Tax=Mucilaginibacter auburnensis TaxID=1457233 RepID=A0A2H9VMA1_9SPHI|nr:tyrosine-protein kinase [Mucilaginibacter auburnensis]PJJ79446.1 capsular exopolysaccharide synthesis family protein [Mucilaginibacter auburnensis]